MAWSTREIAELAATIERLQRVRVELGLILRRSAPTDLPPEFAPAAADAEMSDADRSLVVVMTRVLGPDGMRTYADMLADLPRDPVSTDFDNLPADADEATRQDTAERMAAYTRRLLAAHPGLLTVNADAPGGPRFAQQTVGTAMLDLYNRAQIDVLVRMAPLRGLRDLLREAQAGEAPEQRPQRDLGLLPRQCGAEAVVRALAEPEVPVAAAGLAPDVELLGPVVGPRIEVRLSRPAITADPSSTAMPPTRRSSAA